MLGYVIIEFGCKESGDRLSQTDLQFGKPCKPPWRNSVKLPRGARRGWFESLNFPARASDFRRKCSEYTSGVGTPSDKRAQMSYCILRTKKLTAIGSIAGSAMHTFREIPAPNVDASRTHLNWTAGSKNSVELCGAIKALLPEKRRKDAVLCIEYLITASPEWLRTADERQRIAYFNGAIGWLRKRHGKENIVCLNLQRDETSEHLVAYVVPRTADGRLSAKDFLGGRAKLTAMQTDFWAQVGRAVGLERGLEGSTTKHTTAKQYSAALSKNRTLLAPPQPVITLSDRLSGRAATIAAEHTTATESYLMLIEQTRNEAILLSKARFNHDQELKSLREEKLQFDLLKKSETHLRKENTQLHNALKEQLEHFSNQIKSLKEQLWQVTGYLSKLAAMALLQRMQLNRTPRYMLNKMTNETRPRKVTKDGKY